MPATTPPPMPTIYAFSNPLGTYRLWHVQESLASNIGKLNKPQLEMFLSAQKCCETKPVRALDLYRDAHIKLSNRLACGDLKPHDVIFMSGISKDATPQHNAANERIKSWGLDFFSDIMRVTETLNTAWVAAYEFCENKGCTPKLNEIIVPMGPVLIPISVQWSSETHSIKLVPTFKKDLESIAQNRASKGLIGFGTLEREFLQNDDARLKQDGTTPSFSFRESFYQDVGIMFDGNQKEIALHRYINKRITAAACTAIGKSCRQSYFLGELSGYAGPLNGIFKFVPENIYKVVGGKGGPFRNSDLATKGLAQPEVTRIISGWLAAKWLAEGK